MNRADEYLKGLRRRVQRYYAYGEAEGIGKSTLKSEIKGYLDAGIQNDLVSYEQTRFVIDEEHREAFGMTLEERRARQKLGLISDSDDWSQYESPAYERLQKGRSNGGHRSDR